MPQTGKRGKGKRNNPNLTPAERFETLDLAEQIICWNYYEHTASLGARGWNPVQVGSVYHLRASNYIASVLTESQFRHKARSMVSLAEEFAKLNQAPRRPEPPPSSAPAKSLQPRQPPVLPDLSRTMQQAPRTPVSQPSAEVNVEDQALSVPTAFGSYKEFNYTTRKTTCKILIRQLVHGAVEKGEVEYEWITPRKLKTRIAWPEWFRCAEQMASFTTDADGNIVYPPEHLLTMDTSEQNQARVEEDGNVC
jgi:hypothetical protein